MNNEQLTPRITPTLITSYPDQLAHILNRFIEDFYEGNMGGGSSGNLESIQQTTTSYDDGGVNIITAYLSDGTESYFQIRNGRKGSTGATGPQGEQGPQGPAGQDANVVNTYSSSTTDAYSADYVNTALSGKADTSSLATVATSGSYNDLTNKPTIPTVNNATLTIQKNGTNVQTFTANQSTNATANITVPTSFSGLSGTVSTSQIANNAVTMGKLSTDLTTYSTTEKRIGTWIDGKPIYRKVLTGTTRNGNQTLNHGISNLYGLIDVTGFVRDTSFGIQPIQRVLPDAPGTYGFGVGDFTSTTFLLQTGSDSGLNNKPFWLIITYIKSS